MHIIIDTVKKCPVSRHCLLTFTYKAAHTNRVVNKHVFFCLTWQLANSFKVHYYHLLKQHERTATLYFLPLILCWVTGWWVATAYASIIMPTRGTAWKSCQFFTALIFRDMTYIMFTSTSNFK